MALEAFQQLTGQAIPMGLRDVDTDQIIPAQYLTKVGKDGYGEGLFKRLREQDSSFVLNLDKYTNGEILVVRSNFGCGSSREHAVWAILDYGIKVIIAESFADIFYSNAGKNGLVLVQLEEEVIELILQKIQSDDEPYLIHVDLQRQVVCLPDDSEYPFNFDPFRKECILRGYDDLDYLLAHKDEIVAYQKKRDNDLFYSTLKPNH